ncbi:MAG: adenosylcobinamide-phosphate synthase CbiB [Rhodobacteraceae bacterium]|nr:adenosylcobinamide-phosphate synthase CbiB [Paracoccaceae bacterium]
MGSAGLLLFALVLDAIFGDPRSIWDRFPHPVVLAGRLIDWADDVYNHGARSRVHGVLLIVVVALLLILFGLILSAIPDFGLLEVLIISVLLAQKGLVQHAFLVACGLRVNLEQGRKGVAEIVGRDVSEMDESDVVRATIESLAENFSDAVIAPAFWYLIAGLPGLLVYKFVNTADSMIGHRTARHSQFGWAAARLDDVLNWIPARLTGLLIALAHGTPAALAVMLTEARQHRSPNAGWPESAMAVVLGIALSGPRSYGGEATDDPFTNGAGRQTLTVADIDAAINACWRSFAAFCLLVCLLPLVF